MEHVNHNGRGPGLGTPVGPQSETPARAGLALQGDGKESRVDCAAVGAAVQTPATILARAALVGLEVHELADGSFIVSRWGHIKPLSDLAAVQALVQRMGGAS